MKITFIGTGSAFTLRNWNTSMVINHEGKNLLIDAGGDVRHALHEVGMSAKDIDAVYVTHQHGDHAGGLEWLAFMSYFSADKRKPKLIAEASLIGNLWTSTLSGGLKCIDGKDMGLQDYFEVERVWKSYFEWNGIKFDIKEFTHIRGEKNAVPSFSVVVRIPVIGKNVFITGDMKFDANNMLYDTCDLIIHDCETGPFQSGVHAHYDQLRMLPPDVKAKMLLVHYQDNVLERELFGCENPAPFLPSTEWVAKAKADGFTQMDMGIGPESYGFVPKSMTIDLFNWFEWPEKGE